MNCNRRMKRYRHMRRWCWTKWLYFERSNTHTHTPTKQKSCIYIMTFYRFSIFMIALLYCDGLRVYTKILWWCRHIVKLKADTHTHTQLSRQTHTHTFLSHSHLRHTIKMDILHHFKEQKTDRPGHTCMVNMEIKQNVHETRYR